MNKKIVVVEDDQYISELIRYNLIKEWFSVYPVYDGANALIVIKSEKPALVLLDIMLPNIDGFEICRRLKHSVDLKSIPIIILTAKGGDDDIVKAFQLGADDYIVKPFSSRVLMERIKAVLRRTAHYASSLKEYRDLGFLTMDIPKRKALLGQKPVDLTEFEFDVLELLTRSPGRVFTRDQILKDAWKEDGIQEGRAVDAQISTLRNKFGLAADLIQTVRGVGYRFRDPEE